MSRWKITRRRIPPTQGSPASINLANWTWGGLCLNWPWPRAPPHPRSSSSLAHRSYPPHRLWRSHPIRMIYAWLPSDNFLNVLFCSDCERNRKDHKLQVKSFQKPQVCKGECWLRDLRGWSGGDSLSGSCKLDVNFIPFHLRIRAFYTISRYNKKSRHQPLAELREHQHAGRRIWPRPRPRPRKRSRGRHQRPRRQRDRPRSLLGWPPCQKRIQWVGRRAGGKLHWKDFDRRSIQLGYLNFSPVETKSLLKSYLNPNILVLSLKCRDKRELIN